MKINSVTLSLISFTLECTKQNFYLINDASYLCILEINRKIKL